MRVALIGPAGSIGSRILSELRSRGHQVTGVLRPGSPVRTDAEHHTEADVTDVGSLAGAVSGHDAVVSALGAGSQRSPEIVIPAARALLAALPAARVPRLLVVGGAGSLRWPGQPDIDRVDTPGFPEAWKPSSLAQREALKIYRASNAPVSWTYLSPADLIELGKRTGRYATDLDTFVVDSRGQSRISIEDYAVALVDELERPRHPGRRFTVGYRETESDST